MMKFLVIFLLLTAWIANVSRYTKKVYKGLYFKLIKLIAGTLQGDDKVAPFSDDNGGDGYEEIAFEDNSEIRKIRSIEANAEEDDEIAPLPSLEGDGEEVPSISNNEVDTKIVGGKNASDGAYPHQVSLKASTWMEFHFCGGSIIFPKWVLTAAHCTKDLQAEDITVLAGTNTISSGGSRYEVDQIVRHEKFNRSSLANDIALLKTKNEFEFGPKIAPIALASKETPVGTETTAVGWGVIRNRNELPDDLQMLTMYTVSLDECKEAYKKWQYKYPLSEDQICAQLRPGATTCSGDSGGPLIADDEIIGIVSFNAKPCGQDYPDVFAKVYSFVDWIKDKVGSE
ncbi:chymotrypsin-2-like [Colias croceus]|uniref:chymotrypsin-2-like n=1 Tax=Colias crocea TaxID=72248 RepID=UPI001E27FA87|nr:chymotrypsin-2-like [Colias croceus]